jgi:hypothetical protein
MAVTAGSRLFVTRLALSQVGFSASGSRRASENGDFAQRRTCESRRIFTARTRRAASLTDAGGDKNPVTTAFSKPKLMGNGYLHTDGVKAAAALRYDPPLPRVSTRLLCGWVA